MASYVLSPFSTFLQLFSETGVPLSGGLCWTYLAGTTTPAPTYTDITGQTANSNPIQMASDGRLPNVAVWQQSGMPLKYIFSTNAGTTGSPVFGTQLGPTFDNISGINDLQDAIINSGSFVGSATGFTSSLSVTCNYQILDEVATVSIGARTEGTSNSTSFAITGVPSILVPPSLTQELALGSATNNSSTVTGVTVTVAAGQTQWALNLNGNVGGWGASNTKGFVNAQCFSYLLL